MSVSRDPTASGRWSSGCRFVLSWIGLILLGVVAVMLWLPSLNHGPESGRRSACKNNLKRIGLALHDYHAFYDSFPPAFIADKEGRPMHSWRVLILPQLGQLPLYDLYRFDEPWDGPNNRRLGDQILEVYCCPSEDRPRDPARSQDPRWSNESTLTSYLAVIGPETAWPGAMSTSPSDLRDGASATILVVEVANSGIHWMEPRDLHILQMAPSVQAKEGQGISSRHNGGAHALFGDGGVRFVSESLSREQVHGVLTRNGGEKPLEF